MLGMIIYMKSWPLVDVRFGIIFVNHRSFCVGLKEY